MSKLTAMLKWAMRIVAVGGALLAIAVGTAAWMHRTQGQAWLVAMPKVCAWMGISPQDIWMQGWARSGLEPGYGLRGRDGVKSVAWDGQNAKYLFAIMGRGADFEGYWHGLGVCWDRGLGGEVCFICPTWIMIAVLLLPMGLWAGIGWRRRAACGGGALRQLRI